MATNEGNFNREVLQIVELTVAGDVAGSTTFRFSSKIGRPLATTLGIDVFPYLQNLVGRSTRIQPDKATTERPRITLTMADDPDAPDFDSAVFTVTTGGSFWRRLQVAQPDYRGSRVEIYTGYFFSGVAFPSDFSKIFRGRLEDINQLDDGSVALIVQDDLTISDQEHPAQISDANLIDGAIIANDDTFTVDDGGEITDPASLDSKDFWPVVLRLDPGGTEEDVIVGSISGDTVTVQENRIDKSEEFDDASWVKTTATVTSDQAVTPFGGDARADKIELPTAGTSKVEQDSGIAPGSDDWTASVWLKAGPNSGADPVTVSVEVTDGTTTGTTQATLARNAWQRIAATASLGAAGTVSMRIIRKAGETGDEILAFGAQLEKGVTTRGFYAPTDGNAGIFAGRGAFGTTDAGHSDDDAFIEVILYRLHTNPESGVHPVVALRDLVNRDGVAASDVDQASFDTEFAFIETFQIKRAAASAITEPAKLLDHIKELRESALLDLWASEAGLIKTRLSFRTNLAGGNALEISDEDNVIAITSSSKGNAESRITRVYLHFTLIAGEKGTGPEDFTNHQVSIDLSVEAASGRKDRTIFSKWIFRAAEALSTAGRLVSRFRRGAKVQTWVLDPKDRAAFDAGDVIGFDSVDHLMPSGSSALRAVSQWQVVQKAFNPSAGRVKVEGLEFSGRRYGIISPDLGIVDPANPFPDYDDADTAERQYGFIGDSSNLVGTPAEDGYYIL